MMKRQKKIIPLFIGVGLLITACSSGAPKIKYGEGEIDTPWEEYSVPVTDINVDETALNLKKGDQKQIEYSVEPRMASEAELSFLSSNENVVSVSEDGLIDALAAGQASVTVRAVDERSTASPVSINVVVDVDVTDFTVSPSSFASPLDFYSGIQFIADFTPSDATHRDALTWSVVSEVEGLATIDENTGYLTVNNLPGEGKVVATYTYNNFSKAVEVPFTVANAVSNVTLSLADGSSSSLELNETAELVVDLNGANPTVDAGITYTSSDPDILSVDNEGIVHPNKEGHASVTATCRGVTSNALEFDVFEVFATSIAFSKNSLELSNDGEEQLSLVYGTDNASYTKPSKEAVTYTSDKPEIATVSSSGLVKAISKGTAHITASIKDKNGNTLSANIDVTVTIVAKTITLSGVTSAYIYESELDNTIEFTVVTTPSGLSDETVTYTFSDPSLVQIVESNNSHIVFKGLAEGNVTLTATCNGLSDSKTFVISERPVYFETDQVYLVGNKTYRTGTSTAGAESWDAAKYAYHFTNETGDRSDDKTLEYEGVIHFEVGDKWKIRKGAGDSSWKDLYDTDDTTGEKYWHYEQAGSLANGEMTCGSASSDNITVNKAGTYHIYYKEYTSGWFGIYVSSLTLDKSHIAIGPNSSTVITANFIDGTLTVTSNNESVAKFDSATGNKYTIKTYAVGTAILTFTDGSFSRTCEIVVKEDLSGESKTIYTNANGMLDAEGATPWVHAWNASNQVYKDYKMSLVSGQEIIYYADIPTEYDSVIITRNDPSKTTFSWDAVYNQTKDMTLSSSDLWTMTGYEHDDTDNKDYMVGSWSTFDSSKHYILKADYYLIGSFNSWATYDEDYRMTKESEGVYLIEDVELTALDEVQAISKAGEYLGVSSEYEGCNYTVGGEYGHNAIIKTTGTYDVRVYLDDTSASSGNYLTFTKKGTTPVTDKEYFVIGTINEWTTSDEDLKLSQGDDCYYIEHVELGSGDKIKIIDSSETYYGVADTYPGCGYTVEAGGNLVVSDEGTYTIRFYLDDTATSTGNYITITKESSGGDDPVTTTVKITFKVTYDVGYGNNMYLLGSFTNWATNAIQMTWSDGNVWYTEVELTVGEAIEFKVAFGPNTSNLTWMSDPNVSFTPTATSSEYIIYWR